MLLKVLVLFQVAFSFADLKRETTGSFPVCYESSEENEISLVCSQGKISQILFASYGTPIGKCGSYSANPLCNAVNFTSYLNDNCLNKQQCVLPSPKAYLSDPCVGTLKHFYVQYKCDFEDVDYSCAQTTQESDSPVLDCGVGYIDTIQFASYGTPDGTCGSYSYGSCHAVNSAFYLTQMCAGLNNCTISPYPYSYLSDPCSGVSKRFYIQYSCTSIAPVSSPTKYGRYGGIATFSNSACSNGSAIILSLSYGTCTIQPSNQCSPGAIAGQYQVAICANTLEELLRTYMSNSRTIVEAAQYNGYCGSKTLINYITSGVCYASSQSPYLFSWTCDTTAVKRSLPNGCYGTPNVLSSSNVNQCYLAGTIYLMYGCIAKPNITSGSMTSGSMTSGSMTSGSMTSGPMTSGPMTSGSITSGSITSAFVTSGSMTSFTLTTSPKETNSSFSSSSSLTTVTSPQSTSTPTSTSADNSAITSSFSSSDAITTSAVVSTSISSEATSTGGSSLVTTAVSDVDARVENTASLLRSTATFIALLMFAY